MTKLPGVINLIRDSARDLWAWRRPLLSVIAVVALPAVAMSVLSWDLDPAVAAYVAFATLFMNVALLWAVMRLQLGKPVDVKSAYYTGTAMTVRFVLLTGLYLLMVVPFLLGLTLYLNAVGGEGAVSGIVENLLVAGVWLLLSWPTMHWITRSIFGLFELYGGQAPLEAVRSSREAVRGRAGAVFGRLASLVVVLLTALSLPTFLALSSASDSSLPWVLAGIQIVSMFVVLPFGYIYLYRLYRELRKAAS